MSQLDQIQRSSDVLVAPFGEGSLAYDPVTEMAHRLGPIATLLLTATEPTRLETLAQDVAEVTGRSVREVSTEVQSAAELLRSTGLLDRAGTLEPLPPWPGSFRTGCQRSIGAVHVVIDQRISFRSRDNDLLNEIDAFLGGDVRTCGPSMFIDADPEPDGGVTIMAANEWRFPTKRAMFNQLVDVLNEYAARSDAMLVLHAGAVRTPSGRVIIVPGRIDAGKSTLVCALVQAGCEYLGDESIGVRSDSFNVVTYPKPVTLDATSRAYLGFPIGECPHELIGNLVPGAKSLHGETGPIESVVLAEYQPSDAPIRTVVAPSDAVQHLMANTLNLCRAGQAGLETLCRLAQQVPVVRVVHDDAQALAEELLERLG